MLPRENANCSSYLSTLGVLLVKKNLTQPERIQILLSSGKLLSNTSANDSAQGEH
jgi:hypothetical protein